MNKSELIDVVSSTSGVTKDLAGKVIDAVFSGITSELKQGGKVVLPGFGSFSVKESAARVGRNPQTGEEIKISARKSGKFTAGKNLKGI